MVILNLQMPSKAQQKNDIVRLERAHHGTSSSSHPSPAPVAPLPGRTSPHAKRLISRRLTAQTLTHAVLQHFDDRSISAALEPCRKSVPPCIFFTEYIVTSTSDEYVPIGQNIRAKSLRSYIQICTDYTGSSPTVSRSFGIRDPGTPPFVGSCVGATIPCRQK